MGEGERSGSEATYTLYVEAHPSHLSREGRGGHTLLQLLAHGRRPHRAAPYARLLGVRQGLVQVAVGAGDPEARARARGERDGDVVAPRVPLALLEQRAHLATQGRGPRGGSRVRENASMWGARRGERGYAT